MKSAWDISFSQYPSKRLGVYLVTKGELQQINVLPPYETVLCELRKESACFKMKKHYVASKFNLICLQFNSLPGGSSGILQKNSRF